MHQVTTDLTDESLLCNTYVKAEENFVAETLAVDLLFWRRKKW